MTTKISINDLAPGVFTTLSKVKPMGALQARKQVSGAVALYWRYSIGSTSERVPIGIYDSGAPPKSLAPTKAGYSLAAAVRAAENLALEHHQHRDEGGRPALLAAQNDARRATAEARRLAATHTLRTLLEAYCDHLEAIGRRSHKDARSIFKLHIFEAWPQVAQLPAKDVTGEQFADMMRTLIEAGKGRTANKLRSYARAAYQTAKAAKSKPSIPVAFKAYGVTTNPVAETEPDESANKPDKHPLSADEMRAYWQAIKELEGFKGAALRLHLLTGGQRIEQLVNLRTADIAPAAFTLYDGKGRPGSAPRPHTIPLTTQAAAALKQCDPAGEFAISTDGGETHLAATSLSAWAVDAVGDLIPDFQAKRIRSGVETLLASARISSEIRGRLQSHGVAGVQARHYDGHDYMTEKLEALKKLYQQLQPVKGGKVVALRRA
ncbi:phage integrase/recombinase [Hydrogenophaga taeniospiralis CCUG 15921]|uniref:Phage integrase/recombinase n=1 Tax=Hydrogenophaga taeniospiralis CCUG 15921 TaxID=1281780 RepID=A0A9X4S8C3_9BURK|nr:integrase [Hydrogenophaga taeniospiralis]MDG5973729.1 phage integrase/recombinase [Hydrogenophaga taeniospiralis CCUG 15921]